MSSIFWYIELVIMEIMKKNILRVSFLRAIASRARSITGPRKDSILIFIQDFLLHFTCTTYQNIGDIYCHVHINLGYLNSVTRMFVCMLSIPSTSSNQIRVVVFNVVQLTQASFLQNIKRFKMFFFISVTLRWHRASVACKNQSF